MLQIHDIRESRVYQDALKEGIEKGMTIAIAKMAANKMSAEEIATILKLDVERVRQAVANARLAQTDNDNFPNRVHVLLDAPNRLTAIKSAQAPRTSGEIAPASSWSAPRDSAVSRGR